MKWITWEPRGCDLERMGIGLGMGMGSGLVGTEGGEGVKRVKGYEKASQGTIMRV